MNKRLTYLKIFSCALSILILSACGGGEDETSVGVTKIPPAQVVKVNVSGGVTKGVLVGATINAYNIAVDGTVDYTSVISSAITDVNGLFNLDLPAVRGYLLLQSRGGDFIDETDQNPDINQKRKITFSSEEGLSTVLPPSYNSIALTMISQSIYDKSLREFGSDFYAAYLINIDTFTAGLGFDPLSIIPADPVNPDQTVPETARQYALLAGGLANIDNQVAVSLGLSLPTYEIMQAVIADFSDGNIDGTINGVAISVAGGVLPSGLDLDAAITRFKNNNFTNFQTTSIPDVDYDLLEVPTNVIPDVNAGVEQTILEQDQVSLSATATDSDGRVTVIEWNQQQGTTVVFDDFNSLNPSFTAPDIDTNETLNFTLTVTDDFGQSAIDSVSINIIANQKPIANAGGDQSIYEQNLVNLSGSATDTDGSIRSILWTQTQGTNVTLSNTTILNPSFTTPDITDSEIAIFTLTVTDDFGDSTTDTVAINVIVTNAPLIAAGNDQTVNEQTLVSLSGTTIDIDGIIVNFGWTQVSGTRVSLLNANSLIPSFTAPNISTDEILVFQLSATDDIGLTSTDDVSINIIANNAPIANPDTATVAEGASVTMSIRSNDTDVETPNSSLIITILSTVTNGSLVNNNNGTVTYTHDGSETVADSFSYTINDGDIDSAPAIVSITVSPVNDLPTVTGQTVSTAEDIPLLIILAGADIDGTISSYSAGAVANGSLTGTAPNLTYTPNNNYFGSDSFSFTVTDNDGGTSLATTISINVTAVNDPPNITSIAGTTATEDILYTYSATVSDIDDANDGTQLSWSLTGAPAGMLVSTSGVVTWTALEGVLTSGIVTLAVVDGGEDGVVASTENFTITVTPVNDQPTATPQTLSTDEDIPLSITLAGIDIDGTVISYSPGAVSNGSLTGTAPNLNYTPNNNYFGSDSFTFTVTDNNSTVSTAATISITVISVNDLPSINMPADQNVGVDLPVSLTATASDVDGTISGYQWAQTSGIDVTSSWTNANSQTASFNSPITTATTTLSFTLTVTDNDGGQTTTAHNMTVTPVLVADLLAPTSVFIDSTLSGCVSDNAAANGYIYVHEFVSLNCDSYWVSADYTGMNQLPNLLTLNFTKNYFDDLFFLSSLPLLTTLTLDDISAWNTGLDISSLSSLSSLTSLSLSNADVAVADLSVLSSMTSLTVLNLHLLGMSDITFLSGLSSLTSLDLSANSITTITAVSNFSSLEILTLSNNLITTIPSSTLPTTLATLYLDNNSISATAAIADLSSLTSLANLELSFNSLSDISSLSALTWLSGTLNLSDNAAITDLIPLFGVIENPGPGTDGLINLQFIQTDNMSFGHCSPQIDDLFRELPATTVINYVGC